MELNLKIKGFFYNPLGFIKNNSESSDITSCDRICAVAAFIFISLVTGGLYFLVESATYCYKTRKVSWDGQYTTWKYNTIKRELVSEENFLAYKMYASFSVIHIDFSDKFVNKFGKKIPIIVPRLNFFNSNLNKEDFNWIKLVLIYFGGKLNRPPGAFNEIHQRHFEAYASLILRLDNCTKLIQDIAIILKESRKYSEGGNAIADTYISSLFYHYKNPVVKQDEKIHLFMQKLETALKK